AVATISVSRFKVIGFCKELETKAPRREGRGANVHVGKPTYILFIGCQMQFGAVDIAYENKSGDPDQLHLRTRQFAPPAPALARFGQQLQCGLWFSGRPSGT